ncbi:MAG: hypothetical protein ACSLFQ_20195 [Thermoanaerobaculia bacterium]
MLLGLVLAMHHEAWRDEADSWLWVRDGSLGELFGRLGHMGTPALWYLVLFPFAKAGLPFAAQGLVHVALAAGGAFLILAHAPFSRRFRLLLVFSYFLGFEYLVIARNYAIGLLLLFALAALDEKRRERALLHGTLLALMANTSVHLLFVGTVLFIASARDLWLDRRKAGRARFAGLAIALFGLGAAVWQLWPPADGAHTGLFYSFEPRALRWSLSQSLLPGIPVYGLHVVTIPIVLACLFAMWRHPRSLWIWVAGYSGLLYIMMFKVVGGLRHFGLVFGLLIFCLWVAEAAGREAYVRTIWRRYAMLGVEVCLAVSLVVAAVYWSLEIRRPFSGSKEMAQYLESSGLAGRKIAAHYPVAGSVVLVHLSEPRRFWYPALGREGSYMYWDRRYQEADAVSVESIARSVGAESPDALLLTNAQLERPQDFGFRLQFKTSEDVFAKRDEILYLYVPRLAVRADSAR